MKSIPTSIPTSQAPTLDLPVSALRHTHDTVDGRAIFRHDEEAQDRDVCERPSIYKTFDQLWRGTLQAKDLPPLEVVLRDGKLWCLSNRRLTILKMLQGVSQHKTIWATCVLRPPSHPKLQNELQDPTPPQGGL